MSDKAVYRTAPATPGLLISVLDELEGARTPVTLTSLTKEKENVGPPLLLMHNSLDWSLTHLIYFPLTIAIFCILTWYNQAVLGMFGQGLLTLNGVVSQSRHKVNIFHVPVLSTQSL